MSKIYLCFEIQPPSENDLDQDVKPLEEKAIVRWSPSPTVMWPLDGIGSR